jgi:sigma-B regulation protein RsbU (phosphoserine phosphatase)
MATRLQLTPQIILLPISGPPLRPITLASKAQAVIGRSAQADVRLPEDELTVSRRHCILTPTPSGWTVTDLASKQGTRVNGHPLEPNVPTPVRLEDLVSLGPWTFRITRPGRSETMIISTTQEERHEMSRVRRHVEGSGAVQAQRRLDDLLNATTLVASATTEEALANAVSSALLRATGFGRAALLRVLPDGSSAEVIGFASSTEGESPASLQVSRSLVAAAMDRESLGQVVSLLGTDPAAAMGQSILTLEIETAMSCAVLADNAPIATVYLDTRRRDARLGVSEDAGTIVRGIAKIAGMAMANLQAVRMRERQKRLEVDLEAAHWVQQMLLPSSDGEVAGLRYALHFAPGGHVAGDLFDLVVAPDGRLVCLLGDVAGHGVAASLLMAASQARLRSDIARGASLADAVNELSRFVAGRMNSDDRKGASSTVFITLFAVSLDPRTGDAHCIDAGHSYASIRRANGVVEHVHVEGNVPIGAMEHVEYRTEPLALGRGDRLCIYSDGLVEQMSPDGSQFGQSRIEQVLARSSGVQDDVRVLWEELLKHATPGGQLADDVTIASLEIGG